MSWWGKLIGGTFGFMLGGPLGALLGAALGHNFDRGIASLDVNGKLKVEKIQSAFFTATFSMMGHIAKSDGQVSNDEIRLAQDVMQQMHLNPEQRRVAIRLFEQGKKKDFPVDEVISQFRLECNRRRSLMQMFMEILVATALADGELQHVENRILENTAIKLGFNSNEYQAILRRIQAQSHFHQRQQRSNDRNTMHLNDAYKLLGIPRTASDQEVKKAYRRQMNQHHPDKLVSKGLPQEMMDIANQKTQDIKSAYEQIRKSRKK